MSKYKVNIDGNWVDICDCKLHIRDHNNVFQRINPTDDAISYYDESISEWVLIECDTINSCDIEDILFSIEGDATNPRIKDLKINVPSHIKRIDFQLQVYQVSDGVQILNADKQVLVSLGLIGTNRENPPPPTPPDWGIGREFRISSGNTYCGINSLCSGGNPQSWKIQEYNINTGIFENVIPETNTAIRVVGNRMVFEHESDKVRVYLFPEPIASDERMKLPTPRSSFTGVVREIPLEANEILTYSREGVYSVDGGITTIHGVYVHTRDTTYDSYDITATYFIPDSIQYTGAGGLVQTHNVVHFEENDPRIDESLVQPELGGRAILSYNRDVSGFSETIYFRTFPNPRESSGLKLLKVICYTDNEEEGDVIIPNIVPGS